jgi:hypothetical protein
MEFCSFFVGANRIVEAAWTSNKPLNVVNLTTQEVRPDGKYDRYFPVRSSWHTFPDSPCTLIFLST